MYLISLYFDEKSTILLQKHQSEIEKGTQQYFLSQKKIPVHMTLSTTSEIDESLLIDYINESISQFKTGMIDLVFIGSFSKNTIFLAPVYNEYLHNLSKKINHLISLVSHQKKDNRYQPFHWQPHITLARKLDEKQLLTAFQILNQLFEPFQIKVTRIALSSSQPYHDIHVWNLKDD